MTSATRSRGSEAARPARLLLGGEETSGRLALIEVHERSGAAPPRHLHHWEDEVIYVLAGKVTFYRGDEPLSGTTGTCVHLPRGHEHTYRVESAEARLLIAVAPAGIEASYREVSWADADLERLVAVAARYGVEVTGPPPCP